MSSWFFFVGSWEHGIWALRFGKRALRLKAPWNEPLFSERYGYYSWRICLRGWRLIWSRI